MRRLIMCAAPLMLAMAACSSEPAEDEATVEEPAPEPAAMTAANGSPAGTYASTDADGVVTLTTINADGTYTDTMEDGTLVAEGTYAAVDGKTCFMPTTEGATPMCYTEDAPGEDGSFMVTPDEGEPFLVTPYVAPAAE
jgi:hypothetical protein